MSKLERKGGEEKMEKQQMVLEDRVVISYLLAARDSHSLSLSLSFSHTHTHTHTR